MDHTTSFIMFIFLMIAIIQSSCKEQNRSIESDQDMHIYLCFGQSNMEGVGVIEDQDTIVDDRFMVYQPLNCPDKGYLKGQWRTAVPPLANCGAGLSVSDYFGRTMVAKQADHIKIGVINVAVGGCDIRLFDKDIYQDYDSTYAQKWFTDKIAFYNGNPYQYLINLAKEARKDGVIKGIILHQGETNTGDTLWPNYVHKVYNDMLTDLSLEADNVPLLAGEVVSVDSSCCASMNPIINTLSDVIPTSHVISSEGCDAMDIAHFDSEGYRIMGRRYAEKMLHLLSKD